MAEKDKKYYWLKLKRDFFKRHDIQIIEDMPNGKDYILFYLKLLCESVDHEGNLRFSDEIPYNEQMLSTITRTNIDVVRSAIKVFSSLKMMEVLDDGTYYINEVNKMLGCETYWAERKRIQNQKKKEQSLECVGNFPTSPSKSIDIEKEKDIEIDKELDKELDIEKEIYKEKDNTEKSKHKFGEYQRILLTDDEYGKLCNEYGKDYINDVIERIDEYVEQNNNKNKYKNFYLVIKKAIRDKWSILNGIEKDYYDDENFF